MKIKTVLSVFFLLHATLLFGQVNGDTTTLQWDYPIKPGTEEWTPLETWDAKFEACQIPVNIVSNMSTKELTKVCLKYPLFNTYSLLGGNDERQGIRLLIKRFNGLWELSQREDGVQELIKAYADFPVPAQPERDKTSEHYYDLIKLPFLELVLADSLFLNRLDSVGLDELKRIAVNKYADKIQYPTVYSIYNIKRSMLLAAIIIGKQNNIEKSSQRQEMITDFIKNYLQADANLVTKISQILVEL